MREVPPLCDCQLAHHKKIRGLRTRLFPAFRHQSSHLRLRRSPSLPESPVLLPPSPRSGRILLPYGVRGVWLSGSGILGMAAN
ncbi:hypothetical protein DAI22_04g273050 [Oryza sativa Japonica Group]|nr:hypothetical protein DAI22_04g273050 [Oryza sativa Japonica Group]